jgi:hypothetical protein
MTNYQATIQELIRGDGLIAYRGEWNYEFTNQFIFYSEEHSMIMKTSSDWPFQYWPTHEDEEATDWKLIKGIIYLANPTERVIFVS